MQNDHISYTRFSMEIRDFDDQFVNALEKCGYFERMSRSPALEALNVPAHNA